MKLFFTLPAFLFFVTAPARAHTAPPEAGPAYNEAVNSSGALRETFVEFEKSTGVRVYPVQPAAVNQLLGMPLGDKIRILPIPAVISDQDYRVLQEGARLRARTLVAFYADIILNNAATVIASGLLTDAQIRGIINTENEGYNLDYLRSVWQGRSADDIQMMYGPDLVRNPEGDFVVLEDNIGLIGGVGDLAATHNAFFSAAGAPSNLQAPLVQAIEAFLKDIPPSEWAARVIFIYRHGDSGDELRPIDAEDARINAIAAKMGIRVVEPSSFKNDSEELNKLLNGEYAKVINFSSLYDLPSYPVVHKLHRAFHDKRFELFTAPGIELVANKAFLPFVDRLTELYFKQQPKIRTQETEWVLSADDLQGLESGWAIKKVNGNQGREVFILDHLTQKGRDFLRTTLDEWAAHGDVRENGRLPNWVKQKLVDMSYLPAQLGETWIKFNIDFRPHTFVIRGEPLPPAIWGRASWKIPGVLNNVSQSAMEMVVTTPSLCERELMLKDPRAP